MSDDKFYKDIADKLSDFEMPVSDSMWDAIATSMGEAPQKKPKRKGIIFLPFAAMAAAASIVAIVLLGGKDQLTGIDPTPVSVVADNSGKSSEIQVIENDSSKESSLLADNVAPRRRSSSNSVIETVLVDDTDKPTIEQLISLSENVSSDIISPSEEENVIESKDEKVTSENNQEIIDYWAAIENEEKISQMEKFHPTVSAGLYSSSASAAPRVGSMGMYDSDVMYSGVSMDDNVNGNVGNYYSSNKNNDLVPREEYKSTDHRQPIRIGVSVGYRFAPELSVESGLVFSSLHSTFKESWTKKEYSQNLQYVGIPVSLVWTFYQREKLGVYLSGGAMLEKCVSGQFGQTKVTEHPWQWSVMDAIGAQYNFSKNVGFYIEPGMGYYFKDGSSLESIYTENPTVVSLKLGLRVSL